MVYTYLPIMNVHYNVYYFSPVNQVEANILRQKLELFEKRIEQKNQQTEEEKNGMIL